MCVVCGCSVCVLRVCFACVCCVCVLRVCCVCVLRVCVCVCVRERKMVWVCCIHPSQLQHLVIDFMLSGISLLCCVPFSDRLAAVRIEGIKGEVTVMSKAASYAPTYVCQCASMYAQFAVLV